MKQAFVIENHNTGGIHIDVKRLYLPGIKLTGTCPNCSSLYVWDFAHEYLSYPTSHSPYIHLCWCAKCDHEWHVDLMLKLTVELV